MSAMNRTFRRRRRRRIRPLRFVLILIFLAALVWFGFKGYSKLRTIIYPREYSALVMQYSAENGLDADFVYAVIKCESGFNKDAVSPVGAKGLMQLTDDTFEWVQTKSDSQTLLTAEQLFDPETNIKHGTLLLKLNLDTYGGKREALVAYHAGRTKLANWLEEPQYSKDGHTLDEIPYKDTESYVNLVLDTEQKYKTIYK